MNTIRVSAGVIERDGKILVARRKKGSLAGKWEFPGGTIEEGESPEECLKRELLEELGVETEIGDFVAENIHDYDSVRVVLRAYKVRHISGDFQLIVHDRIELTEVRTLNRYGFAPADIPIVRHLIASLA